MPIRPADRAAARGGIFSDSEPSRQEDGDGAGKRGRYCDQDGLDAATDPGQEERLEDGPASSAVILKLPEDFKSCVSR